MDKKVGVLEGKASSAMKSSEILELLQKDVAEIKVALLGNEYNPEGGLLFRTCNIELDLNKLKIKYDRILWTVGGAAAVLSVIFNLIMAFFDKFVLAR